MTNEDIYDSELAPKLKEIGERCQELGIGFIASVEFDALNGGRGKTEFCPIVQYGNGNEFAAFTIVKKP